MGKLLTEFLKRNVLSHAQWKEALQKTDTRPLYLAIRKESGALVGICPGFILDSGIAKIYQSTPRSDYAGPIIADYCLERAPQCLLRYVQSYCSSNGVAYAKVCLTEDMSKMVRSPSGYSESSGGVVEINLKATPSHYLWSKMFSSSLRKKIAELRETGFKPKKQRPNRILESSMRCTHKTLST